MEGNDGAPWQKDIMTLREKTRRWRFVPTWTLYRALTGSILSEISALSTDEHPQIIAINATLG
jgi:hypothetical protein